MNKKKENRIWVPRYESTCAYTVYACASYLYAYSHFEFAYACEKHAHVYSLRNLNPVTGIKSKAGNEKTSILSFFQHKHIVILS